MLDQIIRRMADGYLLLINKDDAVLVGIKNWRGSEPRPDVLVAFSIASQIVQGIFKDIHIEHISQFQWGNKIGWRELIGHRGEKYDVFGLVQ